jgi:hypothetical protein
MVGLRLFVDSSFGHVVINGYSGTVHKHKAIIIAGVCKGVDIFLGEDVTAVSEFLMLDT